jgi:DNA-binding LacI/PurR family transcriptional regulator/signal transduction histidine kinase
MVPSGLSSPTVGLFVASTDDAHENALIRGAMDACREAGARLVCVNGGTIRSRHGFESMRNVLYPLAARGTFDASVFSGTLCHHMPAREFADFCGTYQTGALVTVGPAVPGIPCVRAETRRAIAALLDHLFDDHGYQRVAFIGGPDDQEEACSRQEVFLERARARGLAPPASWVVHGDYSPQSGFLAMERLLGQGPARFEGVVVANDAMAMGAYRAAVQAGYRVPQDLFITGFDDTQEARFHTPSLTTIRQTPAAQAREAVRLALGSLAGAVVPAVTEVGSQLVVRRSCGCPDWAPHRSGSKGPASAGESSRTSPLGAAFGAALASRDEAPFFDALQSGADHDAALAQILADKTWTSLPPDAAAFGEALAHDGARYLSELAVRREAMVRLRAEELAGLIIECGEALVTSHDLAAIVEILRERLPAMGFRASWLSLWEDPRVLRPQARLVPVPGGEAFPAGLLLPGGLASLGPEHDIVVVEALSSHDRHLGIAVFSVTAEAVKITGSLRNQIGGAIRSGQLAEEWQRADRQLLQSEKLAALGNLVAGVAHEINTPLGIAVSASTYLQSLVADFHRLYESQKMKKSDLEQFLSGTLEATGLAVTNLERAANLVSSFKHVAADQASENRRVFALKEYLEEVLVSLKPQWKNRPVTIELEGPDNLTLDSYPGALAQIVTNLLINSLVHGIAAGSPGKVLLALEDRGGTVLLRFSDDGQGIEPAGLPRIFEPFYTTRRGTGGTGLGLQIVFNLVTQILGGSVTCTSEPGRGAVFEMLIPRNAPLPVSPATAP